MALTLAVIGGGWAGMAAASEAARAGHQVAVFEAARTLGGRARAMPARLPDGQAITIDNGQHILIGAYTETLGLLQSVGVSPESALLRIPLTLRFPDGAGIALPRLPMPMDVLVGIARARGWPVGERLGLLRAALQWKLTGFRCDPALSVAGLCRTLGPRVMQELIEPLCVSALNTPAPQASAQVFLRVLRDALFGVPGGSHLLLPCLDLSALFPAAAGAWLARHRGTVRLGARVSALHADGGGWRIDGEAFDAVVLATSAAEAARLVAGAGGAAPAPLAQALQTWAGAASALAYTAITTVYAWRSGARLASPLLALRHDEDSPAQFVFDRSQLGGPDGLLAFVVSASAGDRDTLQTRVLRQARRQLGLELQPVQTVVEKRATFACTPGLQRPEQCIAPGLLACGDYVDGPYPATLEGAVRSGLQAVRRLART